MEEPCSTNKIDERSYTTQTPPGNLAVTSSLAPQTPHHTEHEPDPNTSDRTGLAVRLVRKTRTNFLLASSKKSRKSKSKPPTNELSTTTDSLNDVSRRHGLSSSNRLDLPCAEDGKRDKHTKSRCEPGSKSKTRSLRKKAQRGSKAVGTSATNSGGIASSNKGFSNKPVFGVPLSVACEQSPSHDGIPLPAFFRHCIDYVEQNGLSTEGIYRVPGVNSQIQAIVSALNKGDDFPEIPPTSPSYYQILENTKYSTGLRTSCHMSTIQNFDPGSKSKNSSHTGHSDHTSRGAVPSPKRNRSNPAEIRPVHLSAQPQLPHDLAVICSVVKYFLRSLPEPVLTTSLGAVMEAVPIKDQNVYETLASLVHQKLPQSHRYLLAWVLQHMTHIIDRSGENLMTQANIIIVLSPCLGISHRLLSILLGPSPPDIHIDLTRLDPSLPQADAIRTGLDPSTWHWLFPHPAYLLRPYRPPLPPDPHLELPETGEELEVELRKQESLLYHLHEQIARGETNADKEAFLWEVQRLVTEIRRRKQLIDPDAIRAELSRQQAQLDRLHKAIAQNTTDQSSAVNYPATQADRSHGPSGTPGSDSASTHKRRPVGREKSYAKPVSLYSDELWEVQRQVTMLKRRLKQQEKLANSGVHAAGTTSIFPNQSQRHSDVIVQPVGGVPLIIPSLSELDEEEVLNLTLRKLPLEMTSAETPPDMAACIPSAPEPCASPSPIGSTMATVEKTAITKLDTPNLPESANENMMDTKPSVVAVDEEALASPPTPLLPPPPPRLPEPYVAVEPNEASTKTAVELASIDSERPPTTCNEQSLRDVTDQSKSVAVNDIASVENSPQSSSAARQAASLEPTPRISSYQIAMYEARKHELNAIQADLRARIRSEKAEIQQLQSRINHLLETGGNRVRRLYEAQFAPTVHRSTTDAMATPGVHTPGSFEQPCLWLARSWTRIAEVLNSDPDQFSDEREVFLMEDYSDGSDESSFSSFSEHQSANGLSAQRSLDNTMVITNSPSRKSTPISYTRLLDQDEDVDPDQISVCNEEPKDKKTCSKNVVPTTQVSNEDSPRPGPVSVENAVDETGVDYDCEDDDEDEGEFELARTLYQLTLDNARLVQLNARYLEGIQAERNRCAELKVLLKLRNMRTFSSAPHPTETFTSVG